MMLDANVLNLLPSPASSGLDLLSILYGSKSGAGTVNPVTALQTAITSEPKAVAAVANQPDTKRDIAAFKAAVAKAKTPADLLADPVARKVLLTANGLGDQTDYAALASKALLSDTTDKSSLANKLTDTRWLDVAKTYDFANKGLTVLRTGNAMQSVADGYAEVKWRESLDASTPGLSNALDFRDRAASITSVDQVLGDKTFREVVTVALGIPKQIAFQSLQAQEQAISSRIDITKFKSPPFVDQFARRYLIAAGAAAQSDTSGTAAATGITSLFA